MQTDRKTNKKEILYEYVVRIHGPIERDTFEAIYGGAVYHHLWGEEALTEGLLDIVTAHRPRSYAPGEYPPR